VNADGAAQPDPKALTWAQRNVWFGTDEEMTRLAYEVRTLRQRVAQAHCGPTAWVPHGWQTPRPPFEGCFDGNNSHYNPLASTTLLVAAWKPALSWQVSNQ
jgi:hypothetical protein